MNDPLHELTGTDLRSLAADLRSGRLAPPYTALGVGQRLGVERGRVVAERLEELSALGMQPEHVAVVVEAIAAARASRPIIEDQVELVWTGPDTPHALNRDTAVVVRELFGQASTSVLVAGFAVYQGKEVFRTLAERMAAYPDLQVRLYLNVARGPKDTSLASEIVRRFARKFVEQDWPPGFRLPEVYYDPRSLDLDSPHRTSLHAKCVVVDRRVALVTSANFTQSAQERNIEAGVVVHSPRLAERLEDHFGSLADARDLVPLQLPRSNRDEH
jgi:phosphatidylserine/phosphatidylglycerophosphate/cardiolipin synthase-like enzyme